MNRFLKFAFIGLTALSSLALGQSATAPAPRFIESTCQGDLRINVRFSPAEATVLYRGTLYSLKQTSSGSGYRYSDGKLTLTGKGTGSRLEDVSGQILAQDCVGGAVLSGTVTYLQRIALPANAVVEVQLQEVSRADAPATVLATQSQPSAGKQVPISWDLVYDPNWLEASGRYIVRARITSDGKLIWTSDTAFPVLQSGQAAENLEIKVVQVQTSSSTPPLSLVGTSWALSSYMFGGVETQVRVASPPTIGFDGARASGNTGCNSYSGGYSVQGDVIAFQALISTLKACAPDVSKLEATFTGLLQRGGRLNADAKSLRIVGEGRALLFRRIGTGAPTAGTAGGSITPAPSLKLPGTNWELSAYFSGGKETKVSASRPTISFDAEGQNLRGSSGCNHYTAVYTAKNVTQYDSLSIESFGFVLPFGYPPLTCAPTVMRLETAFVTLLKKAERYVADAVTLRIVSSSGVLVFTRAKPK